MRDGGPAVRQAPHHLHSAQLFAAHCRLRYAGRLLRQRRTSARSGGAALPAVLLLMAMVLAVSAASFELVVAGARRASNLDEHLRAMQAADAALSLCLRMVDSGFALPVHRASAEAARWREPQAFGSSDAFSPFVRWPGSSTPPQCIVESVAIAHRPKATGLVVTARGFGASEHSQAWLQLTVVREDGKESRHWRRITVRPG